jgi:hypothetical protein
MANATSPQKRFAFYPMLACFLGTLLLAGCGNSPEAPEAAVTNSVAVGPGPGEQVCFACDGKGEVRCPNCIDGMADCPGPCLKLTRGVWSHTMADGTYDPSELWTSFRTADGGTVSYSQAHLGDVIVYQNGEPVDIGKCKICGGTGKVRCEVCKGTGKVVCPICEGKKFIPVAWTPTNNPYFNSQPDVIRLTDGRVLLGRIAGDDDEGKIIVTRDKKVLHVKAADILPNTNTPAAQTLPAI